MINNGNLNWGTLFSKKRISRKEQYLVEGKKTSVWYGPIKNSILIPKLRRLQEISDQGAYCDWYRFCLRCCWIQPTPARVTKREIKAWLKAWLSSNNTGLSIYLFIGVIWLRGGSWIDHIHALYIHPAAFSELFSTVFFHDFPKKS